MVKELRITCGELRSKLDHAPMHEEIALFCHPVIIDAQIDCRHRATEPWKKRKVSRKIQERSENSTLRLTYRWVRNPFLTPNRASIDLVLINLQNFDTKPAQVRTEHHNLLDVGD